MAKHEIILHENTGATKEKAPYLGSYVTKVDKALSDACLAYASKAGMPALKMQTLLENDIEALTELEKSGACRIHLDGGYIELRILGSFAASDSTWDASENRLIIAFTPSTEIRDALINETGTIVTDETSTKVRVDNVFDSATPKPTEVIYGQRPFVVQGVNEVMSDEGAKVEFVDEHGVRYACDIVEQTNRQNVICKLHDLVPEGCDGKIIAYSRGGDAEGQLMSSFRKVKYIFLQEEPVFTGTDPEDSMTVHNDEDERMTINGLNLPVPTAETPQSEFKLEFFSDTPVFDEPYHFVFNENGSTDPHSIAFDECTSEKLVIKTWGIAHDFQESAMPGGTSVAGTLRLTLGNLVLDQDYTFVKVNS